MEKETPTGHGLPWYGRTLGVIEDTDESRGRSIPIDAEEAYVFHHEDSQRNVSCQPQARIYPLVIFLKETLDIRSWRQKRVRGKACLVELGNKAGFFASI